MPALLRIVAPHFVAGIELDENDRVVFCAPIVKYMAGWHRTKVKNYCKSKRWSLNYVPTRTIARKVKVDESTL